MIQKSKLALACGIAAMGSFALVNGVQAQIVQDGSLSAGEGYSLVATQTNVTTSQSADGGGPSAPSNEATATSTGNFTQLSNAYGSVTGTGSAATLNLFIGGSVAQNADTHIDLALQTNGNGVSSLSGQTINGQTSGGGLADIAFDSGFKPNAFIILNLNVDQNGNTTNGIYNLSDNGLSGSANNVYFTDLTGGGAAKPLVTGTLNNALVNTPVGTGAPGDPGFAGASTGLEFSIPLTSLGYTDGMPVKVLAFPSSAAITGRTTKSSRPSPTTLPTPAAVTTTPITTPPKTTAQLPVANSPASTTSAISSSPSTACPSPQA